MDEDTVDIDANDVVDSTLEELRDQRDQAQQASYTGQAEFNPQVFADDRSKHFIIGPLLFDNPFNTTPNITFGLVGRGPADATSIIAGLATADIPFIVIPYVYKWKTINSRVDGFWLGLYALTVPPKDLQTSSIHWQAVGSAPTYLNQQTEDSWVADYDHADTDFLTVDDGASDDSTSLGLGGGSDGGDF